MDAKYLVLESTENAAMQNIDLTIKNRKQILSKDIKSLIERKISLS